MQFGGISTLLRGRLPYQLAVRRAESWGRLAMSAALNRIHDARHGLRTLPHLTLEQAAARISPIDDDTALRPGLQREATRASEAVRAYLAQRPPQTGSPRVLVLMGTLTRFGGNLSTVQLVNDLIDAGWMVEVAVMSPHQPDLHDELRVTPRFYRDRRHFLGDAPAADVVVATWWTTAYAALDLFAARGGFVPAYFVQDFEPWFYPEEYAFLRARVEDTYRLMPFSFAKTPWLCDRIREAGGQASLVPPALDLERFQPAESPGQRVIAMMRPESPQRGFETVKWLFERLSVERPEVALAAFGSDAVLTVDAPFENLGRVPNDAMPAVYQSARVFIECSDFHGFGRTVAEALACGVPCVVTDSGGINAFVRDGENSLVVSKGEREALLEAVLRLLDDDALHARLRSKARESVRGFERGHANKRAGDLLRDLHETGQCAAEYL